MRIPILMYHRIGDQQGDTRFTVSRKRFERQMTLLARHGYCVLSLADVIAGIDDPVNFTKKAVAITFDDGFLDTYQNACPVLASLGFGATFFIVSGFMGQTSRWMERESYPAAALMRWPDAQALVRAGFDVGSHTRTHRLLTELDEKNLREEIIRSRLEIEDGLGTPVAFFAYPYGEYDSRVRQMVETAGFRCACSTRSGFNIQGTDRLELRRIDVRGTDSPATFFRSLRFGENSMTARRVFKYYASRAAAKLRTGILNYGH